MAAEAMAPPQSTSAPPSRSPAGSPPSPASTSVAAGRGRGRRGPERCRQDQPAAGLRRPAAGHLGRGRGARPRPASTTRAAVRRRVGLLGHAAPLYDELTAAENVRFAVRAAGAPRGAADAALDRLGLVGRLAQHPSGGCRPASAGGWPWPCSWPGPPELWLLDEPHAGLDAGARRLLAELVAEAAAGGAAVLLSSHEPGPGGAAGRPGGDDVGRAGSTGRPARWPSAGAAAPRSGTDGRTMWRDALLVAGKDLRIEARSRVALWQVLPFALLCPRAVRLRPRARPGRPERRGARAVLAGRAVLDRAGHPAELRHRVGGGHPRRPAPLGDRPGRDLPRQGGRGGRPAGRPAAVLLAPASRALSACACTRSGWPWSPRSWPPSAWPCAGVIYGSLSAGLRVRETLLPLLVLPIVAPVLLAGSRAWSAALERSGVLGHAVAAASWASSPPSTWWSGIALYGPLQEACVTTSPGCGYVGVARPSWPRRPPSGSACG